MRVLVLSPALDGLGGIQRYVQTLAGTLDELIGKDNARLVCLNLPSASNGFAGRAASASAKLRFALAALWEGITWRPDLVICAHVGIAPLGKLLRLAGVAPYWVMAYGIDVWAELRPRDHQALVCADRVVAISEFTRAQVSRLQGVAFDRIYLLPPCLDSDWLDEALEYSATARRCGPPILLTVSRLSSAERYKGHEIVLQALQRVRKQGCDAQYVIVGEGDDRPRLEELSRSLGLADATRFVGAASAAGLKAWYRDCDIFLMPAQTVLDKSAPKGEGFGIVFLEAMAYGKPVIGPSSGAPSEFIHHGKHGMLVDPLSPEEVANALVELIASPERSHGIGAAARVWVEQEYSHARFRGRLRQLLESSDLGHICEEQCES